MKRVIILGKKGEILFDGKGFVTEIQGDRGVHIWANSRFIVREINGVWVGNFWDAA